MILISIILIPLIASILALLVRKNVKVLNGITIAASVLQLIAALIVVISVAENGTFSFVPYFSVDSLGAILLLIVSAIGFVASIYSISYLRAEVAKEIIGFRRVRQFFVLIHLFLLAMFFAIITTNPVLMWISIEATTLSTAFLISFYNKPSAMEAAWKYLIINSIGLLLAFFGTLLVFTLLPAGEHGWIDWNILLANASNLNPAIARMAFIFILIGYGTKMGLVPMHTWLPDAHSKAPVPISSLLSGVLLNVAFLAILRFKLIIDTSIGAQFSQNLLIFFGTVSILVAAFIILAQKNYKRMLAYSSIEHMGIMALGFGFGGIGVFAAMLHMVYHSLAKSVLFLSAGNIFLKYSSTKIANVRGVLSALPVTGILFLLGFLAITGVPPFGIFITEFYILSSGISAHPIIVIIILFALALTFVGFLRSISAMVFGDSPKEVSKGETNRWLLIPPALLIGILIIISFFLPQFIKSLIDSVVLLY
jgi:hydrogenase-4 component F